MYPPPRRQKIRKSRRYRYLRYPPPRMAMQSRHPVMECRCIWGGGYMPHDEEDTCQWGGGYMPYEEEDTCGGGYGVSFLINSLSAPPHTSFTCAPLPPRPSPQSPTASSANRHQVHPPPSLSSSAFPSPPSPSSSSSSDFSANNWSNSSTSCCFDASSAWNEEEDTCDMRRRIHVSAVLTRAQPENVIHKY